jgi:hypothetical protein
MQHERTCECEEVDVSFISTIRRSTDDVHAMTEEEGRQNDKINERETNIIIITRTPSI